MRCVLCGGTYGLQCAHFIPRSLSGLGVERNLLTLCADCHRDFDQTEKRSELKKALKAYLKRVYEDWNEDTLIYRRVMG